MSYDWIDNCLSKRLLAGLILSEPEESFIEVMYDNEWIMRDNQKKVMYKVHVCGKIIKLDERCMGVKF